MEILFFEICLAVFDAKARIIQNAGLNTIVTYRNGF